MYPTNTSDIASDAIILFDLERLILGCVAIIKREMVLPKAANNPHVANPIPAMYLVIGVTSG